MLSDLITRFIAKRVLRWGLLIGANAIGFATVVGIPIVAIIDFLFLLSLLGTICTTASGIFFWATHRATLLLKKAWIVALAVGGVVVVFGGVVTVLAVLGIGRPTPAPAAVVARLPEQVAQVSETAHPASAAMPSMTSASSVTEQPATVIEPKDAVAAGADQVPSIEDVNRLIKDDNYAEALAAVRKRGDARGLDHGASAVETLLRKRPEYYARKDARLLLEELIRVGDGLDALRDNRKLVWHELMEIADLQNLGIGAYIDVLLSRGIDIHQKDGRGMPVLNAPIGLTTNGKIELVKRGACVLWDPDGSYPAGTKRCSESNQTH